MKWKNGDYFYVHMEMHSSGLLYEKENLSKRERIHATKELIGFTKRS